MLDVTTPTQTVDEEENRMKRSLDVSGASAGLIINFSLEAFRLVKSYPLKMSQACEFEGALNELMKKYLTL